MVLPLLKNYIRKHRFRLEIRKLNNISVLYHHVGNPNGIFHNAHSVTLSTFIRHIEFFQEKWKFVCDEEFFEGLRNNNKGLATLTFDDGYLDTFKNALPFLESQSIPYVFYINKNIIENQFFWRDALRFIYDKGLVHKFMRHTKFSNIDPDRFLLSSKNPSLGNSLYLIEDISNFIAKYPSDWRDYVGNIYIKSDNLNWFSNQSMGKIGNHSKSHPILSTLNEMEVQNEIEENLNFLNRFGFDSKVSKTFSTPFGGFDSISEMVVSNLSQLGHKDVFISESSFYRKRTAMTEVMGDTLLCKRILPKSHSI